MTNKLQPLLDELRSVKEATKKPLERLERAKQASRKAEGNFKDAVRRYNAARLQLIIDTITGEARDWCGYGQHFVEGGVRVCVASGTRWAGSEYYEHLEDFTNATSICDECWKKITPRASYGSTSTNRQVLNADGRQLWIDSFVKYMDYSVKRALESEGWDFPPEIVENHLLSGKPGYTIDGRDLFEAIASDNSGS